MKKFFLTTLILSAIFVSAQPFEKTYPYYNEAFGDLVFIHNDGYTLAGLELSAGKYSLYLIRTDLKGDTLWTRQLDYGVRSLGLVRAVTDNEDNHYISFFDADSAGLVKFSTDWQEVWKKKFDDFPRIYQLYLDSDNKLLLSASGESTCLMKLDIDGSLIWQSAPLGSNSRTNATAITETASGNIALFTRSFGDFGYTFPNNTISVYSAAGVLVDSGYVSPDPIYTYGVFCSRQFDDHLLSLCNSGRGRNYLVHHESDGTILQQKEIMLPGTEPGLYTFVFNNAGGIAAIGNGNSREMIMHGMSLSGDSLWTRVRSYPVANSPFSMALCSDGGYIVSGGAETDYLSQPYLLKTDPWGGSSPLNVETLTAKPDMIVYPNPAVGRVVFECSEPLYGNISIIDMSRRKIASFRTTGLKTEWNTRGLNPGIYFYKVENKGDIPTGKIIIGL